ncbi:hypothetical protein DFH27DRAFT_608405 [Peziza echinospora]|nr:hypothetical protein DFH27DRAFT_608405 [Peziza echinospora]
MPCVMLDLAGYGGALVLNALMVHMGFSLGNALWLNNMLVNAKYARIQLDFNTFINHNNNADDPPDAQGNQEDGDNGNNLYDNDDNPGPGERPQPMGGHIRHNTLTIEYGVFHMGGRIAQFLHAERMEIRNALRVQRPGEAVYIADIPEQAIMFSQFHIHNGDMLGSIRSQRTGGINRDSSWVRYRFKEPGEVEDQAKHRYGRVDYYIQIRVGEVDYNMARIHTHPAEDLQPHCKKRLVLLKSKARIRQDIAAARARLNLQRVGGYVVQPPVEQRKWTWIAIEDIDCLVGRCSSRGEVYIVSAYSPTMVNPGVVFADDRRVPLDLSAPTVL